MTKRRLEQYSSIKAEIKELKEEIKKREARRMTDTVTGSSPEYPFTKHTVTIEGVDYGSDLLTRRLKEKEYLLDEERIYIEKWLNTVGDSLIRRIIRLKYVECMTWQQVAFRIGKHDEQYPRKKIDKFLKETKSTKKPC